jgi:alanine racemase
MHAFFHLFRTSTAYYRPTWIDIDLSAVQSNVRQLKKYIGDKVHLMAVIKANAYGHGMLEIAEASVSAGATWLGVATLDEAIAVRSKLSQNVPILVLGYVAPQYLPLVSQFRITLTGISVEWIQEAAQIAQQPFDFHLKLDTGLNRLGCKTVEEVEAAMKIISLNPNLNWTGVFTHFATSEDMENKTYFYRQLASFDEFLNVIPNRTNKIIHCANSGATLYHPEKPFFNMVRLGKALMGPPNEALKHLLPFQLQTSLSLHSILGLVKQLDAGEKISYGGEYTTTEKQWIGTIPMGYADGWHQQFKANAVLVDGKRVPIVGRISMDQIMVALPQKYPTGTRVTFIGQQGNETIVGDEIARTANQPRSEVFSSLSSRLPRIYMQDGSIISIRNAMLDSINLS